MKKKLLVLVIVLILLGLALPVSNLIAKPDNSGRLTGLTPDAAPVVAILEAKCVVCHTEGAALPFYANFPIAKGILERDIQHALRFLDMGAQAPDSEVALAKLERVVESGAMPPASYKMMHWDGALSDEEKSTVLDWIRKVRAERYATGAASPEHAASPIQPLVAPEGLDPEVVALGKKLFHDVRLSGDDTVSCASCHGLDTGGCDRLQFSKGIGGQVGGINAPTVYDAGPIVAQFWDGRAADLAEQAGGPVENPIEMGAKWPEVVERLKQDAEYAAAFEKLFPDGLTRENVQKAIGVFEETLVTTGSKFDAWLMGDEDALAAEEQEGYRLFLENACATCHVGKILGGQSFELMGRALDYFADRGDLTEADAGRANFTKNDADRHKFKVPTLRNIALTWPYFHDGSTSDLAEAVQTMAKYENGTVLSDADTAKIVAFLKTLTGKYEGQLLK